MNEHNRRDSDSLLGIALRTLPIILLLGTFLVGWGSLKARVDFHEQLLQEMRQDIKEILREVKP